MATSRCVTDFSMVESCCCGFCLLAYYLLLSFWHAAHRRHHVCYPHSVLTDCCPPIASSLRCLAGQWRHLQGLQAWPRWAGCHSSRIWRAPMRCSSEVRCTCSQRLDDRTLGDVVAWAVVGFLGMQCSAPGLACSVVVCKVQSRAACVGVWMWMWDGRP